MRNILLTALLLLPLPASAAENHPEGDASARAVALLEQAAAAAEKIESVRYRAVMEPGGIGRSFWPRAEGTALLSGWNHDLRRVERFYVHLDTYAKDSETAVPVTMGGNSDTFYVIHHGDRRGYEDIDPGVLGTHQQTLSRFEVTEFVLENPYTDEINANRVELLGIEEFQGMECYKIHVEYSAGRGEATWLFAVEDLLPRYRIQSFSIPQGDGSLAITLTDLEIEPKIRPELFRMDLPRGYEKIDDFAP